MDTNGYNNPVCKGQSSEVGLKSQAVSHVLISFFCLLAFVVALVFF